MTAAPVIDLPQCFRLDQVAVGGIGEQRPQAWPTPGDAPHQPGLPHPLGRHGERGRFDDAAKALRRAQPRDTALDDAGLHGQVAVEVAEPPDARSGCVEAQGCACLGNSCELVQPTGERQRRTDVVAGLRPEQHGDVEHRATHRTLGGQLGEEAVAFGSAGHAALGSVGSRRCCSTPPGCAANPCSRCRRPPAACSWPAPRLRRHCCHRRCV